ncbi:hypothetical protein Btru_008829 [Bulinus truncatus]|nr:hypothetical protein Btru_008829 [Bulinus truncatus]
MLQHLMRIKVIAYDMHHRLLCTCAVCPSTYKFYCLVKEDKLFKQIIHKREKSTKAFSKQADCILKHCTDPFKVSEPCCIPTPQNSSGDCLVVSPFQKSLFGKVCNSKILTLMLQKTFSNLKDLRLLQSRKSVQDNNSESVAGHILTNKNLLDKNLSTLSKKELFFHNFVLRYQQPSDQEAMKLLDQFPEPLKLFTDVVQSLAEGDPTIQPCLIVTSYLKNNFWKANLTFTFEHKMTVTGIHQEKTVAIKRAFLLMCSQLQVFGLIYKNDNGQWVPMTCDKVLLMLETLSKYGSACFGESKGRGFKIILEQTKMKDETESQEKEQNKSDISQTTLNIYHKSEENNFHPSYRSTIDSNLKQSSKILLHNDQVLSPVMKWSWKAQNKPFWKCTIHVGWPFPFSVIASALSLPTSQILGYTIACMKLKKLHLLKADNAQINVMGLESLVLMTTQKYWLYYNSIATDENMIRKFNADAVLYSDASSKGFGAYLLSHNSKHVNWLSEEWDEKNHRNIQNQISENITYLSTTLGELYSLVIAINSWKHKLKGRRLLCYGDNKGVVCIVNTFGSSQTDSEYICSLGQLVHILQSACLHYNIKLHMCWISREENWLADSLSRQDFETFQANVPHAKPNKSRTHIIKLKD